MSAARSTKRRRVIVDGSNVATEGRTIPSLTQLDEAVRAFIDEYPDVDVLVVADASFEHRIDASERARFKEAELAGEIVSPPAGAIGRGDAFILKIAARVNAQVLSNDSYQEFQEEHPWLFDTGRLVGGKPVPGVGWIFTERLPVRAPKSTRAATSAPTAKKTTTAKKLTVAMPDGTPPTIGTTLTPVAKKATSAKKAVAKKVADVSATETAAPVKKARAKKTAAPITTAAEKEAPAAQRRDRQPVNPEELFSLFIAAHRVRSHLEGTVSAFTSHGAVIQVSVPGGVIECYAPTTQLGKPAPARARDVLKRGDRKTFKLTAVDKERRIAELALI